MQICSRCVSDTTIPGITFDAEGICNYCHQHDKFCEQYSNGPEGYMALDAISKNIKASAKHNHDCIVGISGGCDSSYLLWVAKEVMGLNPVVMHFDNHWNGDVSKQNMLRMTRALNITSITYTVDPAEYNDIYRAFFLAGLPDLEAVTDIALTTALYKAAELYGVKYILGGHSFRTEGIAPLGMAYMDGRYIADVHKRYGSMPMKTYPNLWLYQWLGWMFGGIKRVRPLYYLYYNKQAARDFLSDQYDWQWYDGHHCENVMSEFFVKVYRPIKTGIDSRRIELSALVRSGQEPRKDALKQLEAPLSLSEEKMKLVRRRLGFSPLEFQQLLTSPARDRAGFKTYRPYFKMLRPLFWYFYKTGRVPKTFYEKYCK